MFEPRTTPPCGSRDRNCERLRPPTAQVCGWRPHSWSALIRNANNGPRSSRSRNSFRSRIRRTGMVSIGLSEERCIATRIERSAHQFCIHVAQIVVRGRPDDLRRPVRDFRVRSSSAPQNREDGKDVGYGHRVAAFHGPAKYSQKVVVLGIEGRQSDGADPSVHARRHPRRSQSPSRRGAESLPVPPRTRRVAPRRIHGQSRACST